LYGEVAAREPTFTGNGVAEVECHFSSLPPSPYPSLRVGYPPPACRVNREFFEKSRAQAMFEFKPSTPVATPLTTQIKPLQYTQKRSWKLQASITIDRVLLGTMWYITGNAIKLAE